MQPNISAFLKVLDPADNSVGGGTASAVAGAMAASLVAMVARLSIGRDGPESDEDYQETAERCAALATDLFAGGAQDAEAYLAVVGAFRLPKESAAQKEARRQAVQAATLHATEVPLENARACRQVLQAAEALVGRSNPRAASDLTTALHLARAGLLGCLANVEINLPGIKNSDAAARIARQAAALAPTAGDTPPRKETP